MSDAGEGSEKRASQAPPAVAADEAGGAKTSRRAALGVGAAIAVGAGGYYWRTRRTTRTLRIACGVRGGTFLPLGHALNASVGARLPGVVLVPLETPGGARNVEMLERREAELALVSNHVRGTPSIALIAPLGEESVHIVARRAANLRAPQDLRGRTLSIGVPGSGTEQIVRKILEHFGVHDGQYTRRALAPDEARVALERGEVDAAFYVAAMRLPVVDQLLARGDMDLLSLGDPSRAGSALEGIRIDAPYLKPTVIPERAYGERPSEPVGTVSASALLVARRDVDEELIQDITAALFADKVRLAQHNPQLARLTERFDPGDSPYPLHPGADRYYRRDDPSFIAKNADQVSLWITLGALAWSGVTALRARTKRARHTRVEVFHEKVHALTIEARAAGTPSALEGVRARIEALRDTAFDELVRDRMEPNESFRILQQRLDALLGELAHVPRASAVRDEGDES